MAAILAGLSAIHPLHPDRTLQVLPLHLAYLVAGLVVVRGRGGSPGDRDLLPAAIAVSGGAVGVIGLLWLWRGNGGGLYASALIGPFGYPNAMAGFLLLAGGAALAVTAGTTGGARGLAALASAVAVLGLALTGSRGALLAALGGLLVWAAMQRHAWSTPRRLWLVPVVLLVIVAWAAPNAGRLAQLRSILGSADGPVDTSVAWRLSLLADTWAMIREHPWLGVGPGGFPVALTHYQRIPYVGGENPHNLLLELAAEYGAVAAAVAILAVGIFFFRLAHALRALPPDSAERARGSVLLATLAAWLAHTGVDMDSAYPAIPFAAAVLAGAAGGLMPPPAGSGPGKKTLTAVLLIVLAGLGTVTLARYTATTLIAWGRLEMQRGDPLSAAREFRRAASINPFSVAALQGLAWAEQGAGRSDAGLEAAARAARIAPGDPNVHALLGELALATRDAARAETSFRAAVDLAPAAHLRYHAGLLDAAKARFADDEGRRAYERALALFTPERVLHAEGRCLAPGDRYLLAHMSRVAAALYAEAGEQARRDEAEARATQLAQPDGRGICGRSGLPPRHSPEAAVSAWWNAWSAGDSATMAALLTPGRRPDSDAARPTGGRDGRRRARLEWVAALRGNEYQALLVYELGIEGESGVERRCARSSTRWMREGWTLDDWPVVDPRACGR